MLPALLTWITRNRPRVLPTAAPSADENASAVIEPAEKPQAAETPRRKAA
jgi:hypothetical protein